MKRLVACAVLLGAMTAWVSTPTAPAATHQTAAITDDAPFGGSSFAPRGVASLPNGVRDPMPGALPPTPPPWPTALEPASRPAPAADTPASPPPAGPPAPVWHWPPPDDARPGPEPPTNDAPTEDAPGEAPVESDPAPPPATTTPLWSLLPKLGLPLVGDPIP